MYGRPHDRLARYRQARKWVPYRVEQRERPEEIGPRGKLQIVNAWTNQVVKDVVEDGNTFPLTDDDT